MARVPQCPFCDIAHGSTEGRTSATLLQDDQVVAFQDRNPSAFRHYLVIPVAHVKNVKHFRRSEDDYALVSGFIQRHKNYPLTYACDVPFPSDDSLGSCHLTTFYTCCTPVARMWKTGQQLLQRDAPNSHHRFGFHKPPFNSVDHLHLHCLALPYNSWWRALKYTSLGFLGAYVSVEKVLQNLDPAGRKDTVPDLPV